MNSTDKLFLLDAYALIYRSYLSKIRESTPKDSTLLPFWDL